MVLVGGLPTIGDLTWVVGEALAGGADVIQLREKGLADRELLRLARDVRILTAQARVPLILNDRVDLARLASCDGVQLGQDDLSVRDARRILGPTSLIGISTHDREQLDAAILSGASYLGVGPVFPSPTKDFSESELAGLAYVRLAAESTSLPWFAIGGINEENIDRVLEAGATRDRRQRSRHSCGSPSPCGVPAQSHPQWRSTRRESRLIVLGVSVDARSFQATLASSASRAAWTV